MMDEPEPDDQQDAVATDDESEGAEPIVIPKSACAGMDLKPGQRITFVVDKVLEDEVTAHYTSAKPAAETTPAPDMSASMME
jgi:hypothetical protein